MNCGSPAPAVNSRAVKCRTVPAAAFFGGDVERRRTKLRARRRGRRREGEAAAARRATRTLSRWPCRRLSAARRTAPLIREGEGEGGPARQSPRGRARDGLFARATWVRDGAMRAIHRRSSRARPRHRRSTSRVNNSPPRCASARSSSLRNRHAVCVARSSRRSRRRRATNARCALDAATLGRRVGDAVLRRKGDIVAIGSGEQGAKAAAAEAKARSGGGGGGGDRACAKLIGAAVLAVRLIEAEGLRGDADDRCRLLGVQRAGERWLLREGPRRGGPGVRDAAARAEGAARTTA